MRKLRQYKGFVIGEGKGVKGTYKYKVYTKEEWAMGAQYRTSEWDADNLQECIDFIDSY